MSYTANASTVIRALSRAGIEVPDAVKDQLEQNALTVTVPDTEAAEAMVAAATNQDELDAAVMALFQATSVADVDSTRVSRKVREVRSRALRAALDPVIPDLYEVVCQRYNSAAEPFTEAVSLIPDLTGVSPADVSPEVSQALTGARTAAAELNSLLGLYQALQKLEASDQTGWRPDDGVKLTSAAALVGQLGEFNSDEEQSNAVHLVNGYARKRTDLSLTALAPHVGVLRTGGRLDLVTPNVAKARQLAAV
ncbi:hypothetical protein GCM10009836_52130 [Pseudonocardia ailaonensis]|uniref:DUF222 domain-containing protein n=1 Tax=Pseudonocardia ailaonensis TaxID=367279 RepID=A0ABN2NE72_9PSEU